MKRLVYFIFILALLASCRGIVDNKPSDPGTGTETGTGDNGSSEAPGENGGAEGTGENGGEKTTEVDTAGEGFNLTADNDLSEGWEFDGSEPFHKDVEVIIYYGTNGVNPLNAGEIYLANGELFCDYLVLFAYNINYNAETDRVYIRSNPNCQTVSDSSAVLIQPLREKGIKVLMAILGDSSPAGSAQLSDWGAREFAKDVAQMVKECGFDGVALDDEYSAAPDLSNKWFTTRSYAAGSRFCYELKKAMIEAGCDNSIVHVYQYGYLSRLVSVDGHDPSEFVDQVVGDYFYPGVKQGNMTLKNCAGMSYECTRHEHPTLEEARKIKEDGYGYVMFFDPKPNVFKEYYRPAGHFNTTALGLYGVGMRPMQWWWKKGDAGQFDTTPTPWGSK